MPQPPISERTHTERSSPNRSKLAPPRISSRLIARETLLSQLMAARRHRCVVLQGPGGCGKTTTVAAWRQALLQHHFAVAWLGLTDDDNAPAQLFDALLAALAQVQPQLVQEAAEFASQGADRESLERATVALVRAIGQHAGELVLVLDDVQHLQAPRAHQLLQWLLDYAPAQLHLVLISRSTLPVSLARLRAQGLVLELDLRELRFSPDESLRFLRSQLGDIDARDAQQLHELSDGWVAGLQLLAVARKHGRGKAGAKAQQPAPVHDASAFASYFEREVLAKLSPAELNLLINASVCNRVCASLCAALIEQPEATAQTLQLLTRLEADNLFITPMDSGERETWWRLHPLLRETLTERLNRRSAAYRQQVHHAAWTWFDAHGQLEEAVHHAVLAGEADAAAARVERYAQTLTEGGDMRKLIGLVRMLPSAQIQHRHQLRLWMLRVDLYARKFERCAQGIAQLQADLPPGDAASHFMLGLIATMLAMQQDNVPAALACFPPAAVATGEVIADGGHANIQAWLLLRQGCPEAARQAQAGMRLLGGQPLLGGPSGMLQGRCLIGLSHAMQGQVLVAEHIYREVLGQAAQVGSAGHAPHNLATALLGEVLIELNEPQAVLDLLADRVDLLERVSIPDAALRLFLALAQAHGLLGHALEQLAHLERLEDFASQRQLPRLLAHSLAAQLQLALRLGQHETAQAQLQRLQTLAAQHPDTAQDPAHADVHWLTTSAQVRWLTAQGQWQAASQANAGLLAHTQASGRDIWWTQALLAQAAIELARIPADPAPTSPAQAALPAAPEALMQALRNAHRLGLVHTVLDAEPVVLAALQQLRGQPELDPLLAFQVERLLSSAQARPAQALPAAQASDALDSLSEREREIVGLLAQALPNKKIARTLGLSPETIKWHLKNIYGKLGVATRDEAVARVRDLRDLRDTQ